MSAPRKTINGRTYAFGTLPAPTALRVELTVAPVVADALAAFGQNNAGKLTEDEAAMITARAVGAILQRIAADDYTAPDGSRRMGLISLMNTVFEHVTIIDESGKPQPGTLEAFTGRNKDKYLVLVEALKVNFADFFPASLSVLPSGGVKAA